MVVVHPLKEWVGFDLLHTCCTNPVLLFTTEPAQNASSHQVGCLTQTYQVEAIDAALFSCLRMRSLAFSDIGTSGGNVSVSLQFITFLYVS